MAKLTPSIRAKSRVMAAGTRIRDVKRLVKEYGGDEAGWRRCCGPSFNIRHLVFEFRWYEHPDVGPVEVKRKRTK